jgi:transcriptional regulator with XRE-family HTH domain
MKIGKKLKQLERLKGVTPDEVSEVLNMSKSNYYKVLRNEVELSADNIQKLANFYNLSIDELVNSDNLTVNITHNHGVKSWTGVNQTFHEENKEEGSLYEKIIETLKENNAGLKSENDFLKKEIEYLKEENKDKKNLLTLLSTYIKSEKK